MSTLPWDERVTMLALNPDAADRDDVARLASELGEANARLAEVEREFAAAVRVLASDATVQGEYGGCNSCCDDTHPCVDPKCSIGAILSTPRARAVLEAK